MTKFTGQDPALRSPHPGDLLGAALEANQMTQKELSRLIGKTPALVNGIIKGERSITPEIAVLLEVAIPRGLTAQQWWARQCDYDLDMARNDAGVMSRVQDISRWKAVAETMNLPTLRKRMELGDDLRDNVNRVYGLYGAATEEEFREKISRGSQHFRKSAVIRSDLRNITTWVTLVRAAAQRKEIPGNFDRAKLKELLARIRKTLNENCDILERTSGLLGEYGIKFITEVKRPEHVPVDGLAFQMGGTPVIAMTLRMNRLDNFAFSLFHELGHVALHMSDDEDRSFIDADQDVQDRSPLEEAADKYASQALWDGMDPAEVFGGIENPFSADPVLRRIAHRVGLHPAIVAGQFQYFCKKHSLVEPAYAVCRHMIENVG